MSETHSGECPLCDAEAPFVYLEHQNIRLYQCEDCGFYGVSRAAESRVREMSAEGRQLLSESARSSPEGMLLMITYEVTFEGNRVVTEFVFPPC